jgi:heme oxygenase
MAHSSGSMLAALRSATASRHAALDEASYILRPACVTTAHYVAFLRCMLAIVRPLEERVHALAGFVELVPDLQLRRRAWHLAADLQAIGATDVPRLDAANLPAIETTSQAFGCGYVLEGSSLGGVVLARTLGPALQLSASNGLSYWSAYGDQVGPMWLRFVSALEGWARNVTAVEREAVVESARATFDTFILEMNQRNAGCPDGLP